MPVTVVITTRNDSNDIKDAVVSARNLTQDILVLDMQSTDNTQAILKDLGVNIFTITPHIYVEPSRNLAISKAQNEWVFILDPDERITTELAKEIHSVTGNSNSTTTYYKIPRKNIFASSKWLKNGGWWPDHQIRLIKKSAFTHWPERIHATPIIEGEFQTLHNPLLHFFHGNLETMVKKTITFENIESDLLKEAGRKAGITTFFRKYLGEMFRRLVKNHGYKDGMIGVLEAVYQAYSKTITYLYLYEKNLKK